MPGPYVFWNIPIPGLAFISSRKNIVDEDGPSAVQLSNTQPPLKAWPPNTMTWTVPGWKRRRDSISPNNVDRTDAMSAPGRPRPQLLQGVLPCGDAPDSDDGCSTTNTKPLGGWSWANNAKLHEKTEHNMREIILNKACAKSLNRGGIYISRSNI